MPLFFFIGGITIKDKNIIKSIIKISKTLIPYAIVTYGLIGFISYIINKSCGIYLGIPFQGGFIETIKGAFLNNFHNNPLFLVCWFLVAYYISYIITIVIAKVSSFFNNELVRKILILVIGISLGAASVNFFAVQYSESKNQIYNVLSQSTYASMFMLAGYSVGIQLIRKVGIVVSVISFSIVSWMVMSSLVKAPVLSWSQYDSGFAYTSTSAFLCILFYIYVSKCVASNGENKLTKFIGRNTRSIMSYHLTIFVLIDIAFYQLGLWDIKNTSVFNHFVIGGYGIIYVILSIIVPAYLSVCKSNVKLKFKK
jgi:fucose 4-O-acetylase-like acetyltransferase